MVGRIPLDDPATERAVDPLRQRLNEVGSIPLLDGRLIRQRVTTNRVNRIRTGLARPYVGYLVVRNELTGTQVNFTDDPTNPRPQDEIWLNPLSGVNETQMVSLWVF